MFQIASRSARVSYWRHINWQSVVVAALVRLQFEYKIYCRIGNWWIGLHMHLFCSLFTTTTRKKPRRSEMDVLNTAFFSAGFSLHFRLWISFCIKINVIAKERESAVCVCVWICNRRRLCQPLRASYTSRSENRLQPSVNHWAIQINHRRVLYLFLSFISFRSRMVINLQQSQSKWKRLFSPDVRRNVPNSSQR